MVMWAVETLMTLFIACSQHLMVINTAYIVSLRVQPSLYEERKNGRILITISAFRNHVTHRGYEYNLVLFLLLLF